MTDTLNPRDARIKHLWLVVGLSSQLIAEQLQITRSTVSGVVSRNGWQRGQPPSVSRPYPLREAKVARRAQPKPKNPLVKPLRKPVEPIEAVPVGGVPLLDLTPLACRWPVGQNEGGDWMFCGQRVDQPPYCSACIEKFRPYQSSKVRAA